MNDYLQRFYQLEAAVQRQVRDFFAHYNQRNAAAGVSQSQVTFVALPQGKSSHGHCVCAYWLIVQSNTPVSKVFLRQNLDKLYVARANYDPCTQRLEFVGESAEFALHESNIAALAYTIIAALTALSEEQLRQQFDLARPGQAVTLN